MNDEKKENSNFENEKYRPSNRENKKKKKVFDNYVQCSAVSILVFIGFHVHNGLWRDIFYFTFILTTKSLRISPIIIMNMENKMGNKNKKITSIHHFIFIIL